MALDEGLIRCAIGLGIRNPEPLNIIEIYSFLESTYDFTPEQLDIHKQVAGQHEPNWKHDLRNLMGKYKSKGFLVNPKKGYWRLPVKTSVDLNFDLLFDLTVKNAAKMKSESEIIFDHRSGASLTIHSYSKELIEVRRVSDGRVYKISKKLFSERITHLILCGGTVGFGTLHTWSAIECGIIQTCEHIKIINQEIVSNF